MAFEIRLPARARETKAPRSKVIPKPRSSTSVDFSVGLRVRMCREVAGMSQVRLAYQLGITWQQLNKYERGTNRIGASRLHHQIALVLQMPIDWFFADVVAGHDGALSPQALADPATSRIVRAFAQISDPLLKHQLIGLVEGFAGVAESIDAETSLTTRVAWGRC